MKFSQHLRSIAEPIWAAQLTHPFVVGLGNGTLPERKFKYYILQDALFLNDLAQVFAIASEKAPEAVSAARFAKLAKDTLVVERSLHETYGNRWKLTLQQMSRAPMAPTNYAYTRHMLHIAQNGTALDATVVTLPCAWIYCVVGQHLLPYRSEEHTSELQSPCNLVCRLLLEKKKKKTHNKSLNTPANH